MYIFLYTFERFRVGRYKENKSAVGSSLGHASLASDGADSGGSPHRVSVENPPDCPVTPLELGDAGAGAITSWHYLAAFALLGLCCINFTKHN